ncbi:uncharacterized protein LOC124541762 [Vanessa cardui]|uniref:uncharacterized protein LOC124541762 n=1 Tax=Vanessa cardui TaxID=171605 RepID=UPI001F135294|nr:uncharacterized protein LOC124541762 [Vanessa cardui]
MESIKHSIDELTLVFNARMNDFQKELKGTTPATSPMSNINSQFNMFRSFVLTALQNLQLQVEFLSKQQDNLEMHSRKKVLLLHGVPETNKEDTAACVSKLMSERLKLPQIIPSSFSVCHRLGRLNKDKPRVILVRFKDVTLRNQVWSSKTSFKGSGITVSEFLTKARHKVFLAARQRFGVTKSWTRDGTIMVIDAEGSRHRVTTMMELDAVSSTIPGDSTAQVVYADAEAVKPNKPAISRIKRIAKK